MNDTVLRYFRDISSSSQISISIFQFVNTLGVLTIPPIKIYFKEAAGNIVAQNETAIAYTTVAGSCTVASAVRQTFVLKVALTGASYYIVVNC